MKVTVYCKINYQGKKAQLFNLVKMSIIHYGKNDDKNKFICEEGLKDDPLLTLKADEITGSIDIYEEINSGKCTILSDMKKDVKYQGDMATFNFKFSKSYLDQSFKFPLYVNFGEPVKSATYIKVFLAVSSIAATMLI